MQGKKNNGSSSSVFPSVSACMIVKDEEHNLPRCLKSIAGIVDEIIVVDTGSSDRTVEIAESFGAKVYHHPWENNFSKHRNQSISYATKDWILIIDADEEFVLGEKGLAGFKRRLFEIQNSSNNGHLAAACVMKDIQSGHIALQQNTARLFKRGHIKYNGIVHNQAVMDSKASMMEEEYFFLRHYGYDLDFKEMQEKKTARTLPLILKWMEEEPDNYQPHFYLTQIYIDKGDLDKAVKHGEIYLMNRETIEKSGEQNFNKSVYYSMFATYMRLGKAEDANRWLTEGLKHDPVNLDLSFALVQYGVRMGQHHLIYLGANQFTVLYEEVKNDPMKRQNLFMYTCNPESYAYCLFHLALSQFRLGIESIQKLKGIIATSTKRYQHGLMADLKSELTNLGFKDYASKNIHFESASVVPSLMDELRMKNPEVFH